MFSWTYRNWKLKSIKNFQKVGDIFTETVLNRQDQAVSEKVSFDVPNDYMVKMTLKITPKAGAADPQAKIIFRGR